MENTESRIAHEPEAPAHESASSVHPSTGVAEPRPERAAAPGDAHPGAEPPADPRFETEAEARAYWAGVGIGLQAAGRGGPPPSGAAPAGADIPAAPSLSDILASLPGAIPDGALLDADEPCRRPRSDGFTPERTGLFLRHLAASGVVEQAAAASGVSAQAAYAFRNRRSGRAFARMWDAVLVHRSRARVASELSGRAIAGCVSRRVKDGAIVSEYHYHDNRLAMSLLTRLDRLAEKEEASDAHLRALSEDLDAFVDCLASGGDPDAFVEARRPPPPAPPPAPEEAPAPEEPAAPAAPSWPDEDTELTTFARMAGCHDYLDVSPVEIDVLDLDHSGRETWSPDQWVRAVRSGFMAWLAIDEEDATPGHGAAFEFQLLRDAARAAVLEDKEAESAGRDLDAEDAAAAPLELACILEWDRAHLARAWRSRLLLGLPERFWADLAAGAGAGPEEDE